MANMALNKDNVLTIFGNALAASASGFAAVIHNREFLESLVAEDDKDEKFNDFVSKAQFEQVFLLKFRPIRIKAITIAGWEKLPTTDMKLFIKQPSYGGSIKEYYNKFFLGALIRPAPVAVAAAAPAIPPPQGGAQ